VTDAEVREMYDQYAAQSGEGEIPPFEEVRDLIEDEVAQQKQGQVATRLLGELEAQSDIEIYM
jgi:hypothetical protein